MSKNWTDNGLRFLIGLKRLAEETGIHISQGTHSVEANGPNDFSIFDLEWDPNRKTYTFWASGPDYQDHFWIVTDAGILEEA